jgi:hypothetical protein
MTMTMIADRNMGINKQVAVLLEALSVTEIELPDGVWITTSPYGNCRERGFVLSIHHGFISKEHIVFFEHRNSDSLCCVRWKGGGHISGVFRYDDIDPAAYPDKYSVTKSWDYLDIRSAVDYVKSVVAEIANAAESV